MSDEKVEGEGVGGVKGKAHKYAAEHTAGGVTTRDDATDLGVPMLPGSPDEPQGPEDALGEGPKRGDYTGRVGPSDYQPHQTVANPDYDPEDESSPTVVVEAQRERAEDIGDAEGQKGGVDTAPAATPRPGKSKASGKTETSEK